MCHARSAFLRSGRSRSDRLRRYSIARSLEPGGAAGGAALPRQIFGATYSITRRTRGNLAYRDSVGTHEHHVGRTEGSTEGEREREDDADDDGLYSKLSDDPLSGIDLRAEKSNPPSAKRLLRTDAMGGEGGRPCFTFSRPHLIFRHVENSERRRRRRRWRLDEPKIRASLSLSFPLTLPRQCMR